VSRTAAKRQTTAPRAADEPPAADPAPSPRLGWLRGNPLAVTALIVAAQALIVTGYGVYLVIEGFVGHPISVGRAELAGWIVLVCGVALLLVPAGLWRARRWARTPAVMLQLLGFWMAYYLAQANLYAAVVPLVLVDLVALVLLLSPQVTQALYGDQRRA
jgi:hypothetical protein